MLVKVGNALEEALRGLGIVQRTRRARALDVWPEVVGHPADEASVATSCRDGVLFVSVRDSVWASELALLKTDIIRKLNQRLGRGTIVDIKFRATGEVRHVSDARASAQPGGGRGRSARRALTRAEIDEVRKLSSGIADARVGSAFARALAAAMRARKPPTGDSA